MAVAPKPKTAEGYSSDHTNACEQVLVTLLGAFGTLKATIRLVAASSRVTSRPKRLRTFRHMQAHRM